ncbi:3-deoxy-7-phosphoheptulonate synthase class II [Campylobacter lari]|uniref:Phospho-2-dehydro-3-deoxyheptonate aldolase n=1 Tax=Campylobacter lari (strain RM2100 / D67 / ATCC BAA-1060) TaxID=306263 RepID=B9KCM4_CAMLR|nr:3-deoxy-7-phosphoheptulonate synthase class II [Campylobacter lari]ACM64313.1 2-dehydro-3-deoxyphosphoheptonate aldolase (DAHP synthetase, class II) [Campylobacter lari RM2100]EAH5176717.1 3-deoxy-7-phosphoheptulonate synthase class II [Campylobacter lari]EAI3912057.1 3-deoxy-7-phosphoheptulonate synthase class II [Campylobacter lari]EAJ0336357.1 3-deoxy-7-phosphoheptulonate synthase class II [Campylobacter lari]EAK0439069.1 3-deoxy-7-phosphoheptulonate synthase class II [Campylobacter lari
MKWTKDSWKNYKIQQQPQYPDENELQDVVKKLEKLPPLVFAGEVDKLKKSLANVVNSQAFLLQGGDCAESFVNFGADNIRDMFKVMLQMAIVLTFAGSCPIVKVGRVAGQFAKPRSNDFEEVDGVKLPSYRGDIINGFEFNEKSRIADPKRILEAYYQSATTLNLLRAFSRGGLADLRVVHKWNLGFLKKVELGRKYDELSEKITQALAFMQACGITDTPNLSQTAFYTSHEALLLPYEEALTRVDSLSGEIYDCSAHMLWIGERTRKADEAHVHFLSGVKNPLGVKLSANYDLDEIKKLVNILNPHNEAGRLNFIIRMGCDKIENALPKLFKELKQEGFNILYSIDPMHANTVKSGNFKTREFDKIIQEVRAFFEIAMSEGVYPGGVHLEMTGQNVTECVGGSLNITQEELSKRYETQCDPRLNADQALELAFIIADLVKKARRC